MNAGTPVSKHCPHCDSEAIYMVAAMVWSPLTDSWQLATALPARAYVICTTCNTVYSAGQIKTRAGDCGGDREGAA